MSYLPKHDLMHTVFFGSNERPIYFQGSSLITKLLCKHNNGLARYAHIDHRTGPGSFADIHEGFACVTCGKVLSDTLEDNHAN